MSKLLFFKNKFYYECKNCRLIFLTKRIVRKSFIEKPAKVFIENLYNHLQK